MKAIRIIMIGIGLIFASEMQAQLSVNVNIGTPPMWGPSGYSNVRYYYLPDVEAYYDVQSSNFIYFSGNTWVRHTYLPRQYRNYDLYNGYKVVMTDYRGNAPYKYYNQHKSKYAKGYKGKYQKTVGNRSGHSNGNKQGNGNHNSNGNGNGNGNNKGKKH
ncbi:MAG TPA: hypothetical protein VIO43_09220 [Lutibacter sp.]